MRAVYLALTQGWSDGVEDIIDRYPECEFGLCFTSLTRFECMSRWFINRGRVVVRILPWEKLWLRLLDLGSVLGRAIGGSPSYLFNLYVFLCSNKDVPHLGDIILHQMRVKRVGDM